MPEGCTPTEQVMGSGTTVYYLVDSLETVSHVIGIVSRAPQADYHRLRRKSVNVEAPPVWRRQPKALMGGL